MRNTAKEEDNSEEEKEAKEEKGVLEEEKREVKEEKEVEEEKEVLEEEKREVKEEKEEEMREVKEDKAKVPPDEAETQLMEFWRLDSREDSQLVRHTPKNMVKGEKGEEEDSKGQLKKATHLEQEAAMPAESPKEEGLDPEAAGVEPKIDPVKAEAKAKKVKTEEEFAVEILSDDEGASKMKGSFQDVHEFGISDHNL